MARHELTSNLLSKKTQIESTQSIVTSIDFTSLQKQLFLNKLPRKNSCKTQLNE